jgi:hypothetical protein
MNEVGLVDDRFSEVPAEVLWSSKVNPPASEKRGKLPLKACHTEKTGGSSRFELDKHIDIALGPEISARDGAEQRKSADSVTGTEFSYLFITYMECWCHVATSVV